MTHQEKRVLLALLGEIEDLQVNLVVLGQRVGNPPTVADAREAKNLAFQLNGEHFDNLRKQIEALA